MKGMILSGVVCAFLFATSAFGVPETEIEYVTSELPSGRWQYTYEVISLSLPVAVEEFTIWFDFALYDNLAIETLEPLASQWDEIVVQPEHQRKQYLGDLPGDRMSRRTVQGLSRWRYSGERQHVAGN